MGPRTAVAPIESDAGVIPVPPLPTYGASGHDLTLVRMMLECTPIERIRQIESAAQSLLELRRAFEQTRVPADPARIPPRQG